MKYEYKVRHNGIEYLPGEDVPDEDNENTGEDVPDKKKK